MIESRRQQFLAALIGNWDQKFDPATGLSAAGSCGIRESLFYALVLLEQGEHSRLGRAEAILRRSIDTTCPRKPDMWLTLALVWIWSRYRQRFSPDLQKRIANVFCDLTESPLEWFKPQDKVAIQFPNTEDCLRQLVFSACMEASGQSVQNQFFPPSPPPPLKKAFNKMNLP